MVPLLQAESSPEVPYHQRRMKEVPGGTLLLPNRTPQINRLKHRELYVKKRMYDRQATRFS
jgi:hypothetical protein